MLLHKVQRGLYRAGGRSLHVFVSAGEPSGDMFAAATMRAIRHQSQDKVSFCGIGGEMMRAEGLDPIFEMSELSAMGIFELIQHLPRLRKRMQEAISAAKLSRPDIVLTVDSKGFNNRLLRALKRTCVSGEGRRGCACGRVHRHVHPRAVASSCTRRNDSHRPFRLGASTGCTGREDRVGSALKKCSGRFLSSGYLLVLEN